LLLLAAVLQAQAGGGPLGIDHRLAYDNSGIWKRSNQTFVEYGTLAVVIGGALWEGGETRLGKTCWQALDAAAIGAVRIIRPYMHLRLFRHMTPSRG
jgi:undecaprenyl-diphosphatase